MSEQPTDGVYGVIVDDRHIAELMITFLPTYDGQIVAKLPGRHIDRLRDCYSITLRPKRVGRDLTAHLYDWDVNNDGHAVVAVV